MIGDVRRLLRVLSWLIAGIIVLAIAAGLVVYIASNRALHRKYEIPLTDVAVPSAPEAIAEGQRLARIYGCYGGCHGKRFEGNMLFEEAHVARLVAPSLNKAAARYTNAELVRIIRHGVRPNRESVFGMPSSSFKGMSDADLGAILAFLRQAPDEPGLDPRLDALILGRVGILTGKFRPMAATFDHDTVRPPAVRPQDRLALGDYLAHTICAECHGHDLHGIPSGPVIPPDLRIAGAYSLPAMARLLREGIPAGGQTLGVMGSAARGRFSHFTDEEIAAVHAYLTTVIVASH